MLFIKGFLLRVFLVLGKFKDTRLPELELFYNHLRYEGISHENNDRGHKLWSKFGCQTFKDYRNLYLKTDVLLLADVFEYVRKLGHGSYGLNPAMYLTLPSFSWDACLKTTDVKLELITDHEIEFLFENNIVAGYQTPAGTISDY